MQCGLVVKAWNQTIKEGGAYVFITPEYNHSVPGVLKNAIDSVWASFAFRNKPVAAVGYSAGIGAGIRRHVRAPCHYYRAGRLDDALDKNISPISNMHADRRPELYRRIAEKPRPTPAQGPVDAARRGPAGSQRTLG